MVVQAKIFGWAKAGVQGSTVTSTQWTKP